MLLSISGFACAGQPPNPAYEQVQNVMILGDTFLAGRAVVYDIENMQVGA